MKRGLGFLLVFTALSGVAQITDDSTKQVYGSKTTLIVYEDQLKNNRTREIHPDTTLYELEKFTFNDVADRKYQDLGNNGTAVFPLFYPIPDQIGRTSGFSAYNPMLKSSDQFKYYDSKSPHINLMVAFGGDGRSVVDMGFTRNVNENWNVGFDIFKITSDKQIGKSGQQDRNALGNIVDLYTYYKHSEKPYSAMFHVMKSGFKIEETGGIFIEDLNTATRADLFEYQDSDIQLKDAKATDDQLNVHLFHEYAWTTPLQFYHQLDWKTQTVGYQDFTSSSTGNDFTYDGYYNQFLIDQDSTYELFEWREFVNEVGVKGDLANLFYRIYLKRRDIDYDQLFIDPTSKFSETFLGGFTRFDWREKFDVVANAELSQSGEYRLQGKLNSELLFGSYTSLRYKPSFLVERYFTNHHEWDQSFNSAFTNEIKGGIKLDFGWFYMRPQVRLVSMNQFFYYDESKTARQSADLAVISSLGGDFNFRISTNRSLKEAFHIENEMHVTTVSGAGSDNIEIPEFFYNGRIFWRGAIFKKTMGVEIGVNVHAKSAYYAMGYAPELQQYHLQNEFQIDAFYTMDAFFNMRINNVRAFVKMTNLNQQNNNGYFVTPYYPGQAQVMDFGVRWLFFD